MKDRAGNAIAHGALTNSKRPSCFVEGVYPTHVSRGEGCYLYTEDGRRYIDFICGLGANLLGYGSPEAAEGAMWGLANGPTLSLSSTAEVHFAEDFKSRFPFVDRIRILKSGSEGCSAAARMARAATGKSLVLSDGYHGWHDDFVSLTPPAVGIPKGRDWIRPVATATGEWQDVAAVIIEPVVTDTGPGRREYLEALRERCTASGAVLVFDETITGLRFPGLSVSAWSGVAPDIIVTGKALANGLPISVVGGRAAVMDSDYFVSSTFAGDLTAIGAAMATMAEAAEHIDEMWAQAASFQERFSERAKGLVWIEGYPTRGILKSRDEFTRGLFMQEMCSQGVLFGPSFFWCLPHAEVASEVLRLVGDTASRIEKNTVRLRGRLPAQPYAEKVRGHGR